MTTFLVTHGVFPLYQIADDVILVWMSELPPPEGLANNIIRAYDYFDHPTLLHDKLSGSLGALAILRYLRENQGERPEKINICSYRKFVCRFSVGKPNYAFKKVSASNYLGMQILDQHHADHMRAYPFGCEPELVVAAKRNFPEKILKQFANCHKTEHLLLLLSAAIATDCISRKAAAKALEAETFIPGGVEVGVFPMDFWVKNMSKIEQAIFYYFDHYWKDDLAREAQFRELSFALERLGSFIVLEYIKERKVSGHNIQNPHGFMHTVITDGLEERNSLEQIYYGLRARVKKRR